MKTILRINGTKQALFQTVEKCEVIKNKDLYKYSEDHKKYGYDLAHSGDLCLVNFDRDIKSFIWDIQFAEIGISTEYGDCLYNRDFNAVKKSISTVNRIEKALNYPNSFNDVAMLKQLFKLFKVEAVTIEVDGKRKTFNKGELNKNADYIFEVMTCEN